MRIHSITCISHCTSIHSMMTTLQMCIGAVTGRTCNNASERSERDSRGGRARLAQSSVYLAREAVIAQWRHDFSLALSVSLRYHYPYKALVSRLFSLLFLCWRWWFLVKCSSSSSSFVVKFQFIVISVWWTFSDG